MTKSIFNKPFTQQEPIPEAGIARAVEVMRAGRLHRYNVIEGETAETSLLETEFAAYMGQRYCLACASGGYALHIALKAAGIKSGEAVLTTDDPEVMARAIILSGSYMLFESHDAAPEIAIFKDIKLDTPNYSGRMDNLRAVILRAQLPLLDKNCERWNVRYRALEQRLAENTDITLPSRPEQEDYVASSLQFRVERLANQQVSAFIADCANRGVELKWFGGNEPQGFTSRYDSWRYIETKQRLPQTLKILACTFDLRIPLTFSVEDMLIIGEIIDDLVQQFVVALSKWSKLLAHSAILTG